MYCVLSPGFSESVDKAGDGIIPGLTVTGSDSEGRKFSFRKLDKIDQICLAVREGGEETREENILLY